MKGLLHCRVLRGVGADAADSFQKAGTNFLFLVNALDKVCLGMVKYPWGGVSLKRKWPVPIQIYKEDLRMKTKNILMMLVAMLLILSSCDDAAFLTEPEISFSPSQPETETPSDTSGIEPLPDAYVMKGGKLRLYVGGDRKMDYYTDVGGIMFEGLTAEEVKEKFLTVNFTPEEIEHMQKVMADDGGYVYVPDQDLSLR